MAGEGGVSYTGSTLALGASRLGSIPSTPTVKFNNLFRAHSKVALRYIRIVEAAVRFRLGPQYFGRTYFERN